LAKSGKKTDKKYIHRVKKLNFVLKQNELGEWFVQFQGSDNLFPATDIEVNLWLMLMEAKQHE